MVNLSKEKTKMRVQAPDIRNKNFLEVELGYNKDEALNEASRCLNCKNPECVKGCPVGIKIPAFIECIRNEEFEKAYEIIKEDSLLPSICGRVCPQESQCEGKCVRGLKQEPVGIGKLERFVGDYHRTHSREEDIEVVKNNYRVAVIGSGPSGLTCAYELAKKGYEVTIFEALHEVGGVLVYGIPEFRLPKEIVNYEIDKLKRLGVTIISDVLIGKSMTIDELMTDYKFNAVFIGTGAGLPKFMNIPGENLNGVYSANEFLTRVNLMKAYKSDAKTPIYIGKRVAVIGGGNVAMDAARSALRLGAENVYIIYRRSEDELPARKEEVIHAKEEGIIFKFLTNPTKIIGDDQFFVSKIGCVEMELGELDSSGRRKPIVKENSEFEMDIDMIIMALGTSPNPIIKDSTKGLETKLWGGIIINDDGSTSKEGVFAGGDVTSGAATVILAMEAGKKASKGIDDYLKRKYKF